MLKYCYAVVFSKFYYSPRVYQTFLFISAIMPSLRRNYRACSPLMVNKAEKDALEKLYYDRLHKYNELSRAERVKSLEETFTPERKKEFDEFFNNFIKEFGLDKELFTPREEAKGDEVPAEENQSAEKQGQEAKEDEVPTEENQSAEKQGIEKVVEDIGKLLVSGENSDVTVQVGDVQFKAHRAILSARCPALSAMFLSDRSPILSAMFWHETKERTSNSITIEDCEPEVFGDFLHYLYKGSPQRLSKKNVFGLYRVANKYLADDLKKQCLQHIRDTLSVETFCDVVQLAQTDGQSDLLQQAMDFATQNIQLIIRTVQWQNFIHDHTFQANEIVIKALGLPS